MLVLYFENNQAAALRRFCACIFASTILVAQLPAALAVGCLPAWPVAAKPGLSARQLELGQPHTPNGSEACRAAQPALFHNLWGLPHPMLLSDDFVAATLSAYPCLIAVRAAVMSRGTPFAMSQKLKLYGVRTQIAGYFFDVSFGR